MKARAVSKARLPEISGEDWIDRSRSPYAEGETVWVPVREGQAYTRELPERCRYAGRGFFMLGNVAVCHGKRPRKEELDEMISFRHPEGILWIEALEDVTRTPRTEVLWGDVGEVCHHENGYVYFLNPREVMFAQGNRNEKQRMARLIRDGTPGARVADMFAGIGYFTIPMAGSGAPVHAMEINPVAFGYLVRNIAANHLTAQVHPALGDCRELLEGEYDRIVMGYFDAIRMLPEVMSHVHSGSVIHVHSIGNMEPAIMDSVKEAGFSATIVVHTVKKYRPHEWHLVHDVTLS